MMFDVLSNDVAIRIKQKPFKHAIFDNLFNKDFYKLMCNEFKTRLNLGLVEKFSRKRFFKFAHYDAYCWAFDPEKDHIFSDIFYSVEWKKFINNFFDLKLTKNVIAEFHHHKSNSEGGYIHNDYDISSFIKEPLPNGINPHRYKIDYRGRVDGAGHCVRSIAMIYYFNNPKWESGGETALHLNHDAEPTKKIVPLNNRLLAFEISPGSWHSFLSNKKIRNSMVMWFHSSEEYMLVRYGEKANEVS